MTMYRLPTGQRGAGMIEVLVSALILAIGLTGLAGIMGLGLQTTHSAYHRTQATILAYAMADRMRANREGVEAGHYNLLTAQRHTACRSTTGCSEQELAQNDAYEWRRAIADHLPGGAGEVCIDSTPDDGTGIGSAACDGNGRTFVIKVWWNDDRRSNDQSQRFVTSFEP